MGLCASQARLLMLTARKSDLEYRRMQITNAKQLLAMEQEEIATEYSSKISDMHYVFIDAEDGNEIALNYDQLNNNGFIDSVDTQKIQQVFGKPVGALTSAQIYECVQMGYIKLSENLDTSTSVKAKRYEENDTQAEARYTEEMAKVKRKETALDLEAQQIETQYTAVSSELEAVQSLVKKNAEKGMKYFS